MKRVLLTTVAILMLTTVVASAQNTVRTSPSSTYTPESRVELIPIGGYAWTLSRDVIAGGVPGQVDFSDKAYYGGALDFTVSPPGSMKKAQVRLMYRRSDGQVQLTGFSQRYSIDGAIEYWHIGGVTGIDKGKSMPFATLSLGGTRLVTKDSTVGSTNVKGQDTWKFSMIFGLGVKVYTSPKVGIMLSANWPITFTDTWGGVTVGTGGAGVSMGGTGISQLDVGGGLIIRL
jgi:opacity protein-like surface antigen